jgi:hypothetical protein
MQVFQLTGVHYYTGEPWDYSPIFSTKEKAQEQIQKEICAYKGDNGYVCPFDFVITEIEVQ